MTDEPDPDQWLRAVWAELRVSAAVVADPRVLLDVARGVAHSVLRSAAPLTTYVVGVAVGLALASGGDVAAAVRTAATGAPRLAEAEPS
jgi:Domain of unknown function (DUF6457)